MPVGGKSSGNAGGVAKNEVKAQPRGQKGRAKV